MKVKLAALRKQRTQDSSNLTSDHKFQINNKIKEIRERIQSRRQKIRGYY